MAEFEWHQLRDDTDALLERVAAGESITITVDRRPVATLEPVGGRPRFMDRDRFIHEVLAHPADPDLLRDVRKLTPDA